MTAIQSAYTGQAKYIFISYSHNDAETVYPIIAKMQSEGYRIWYDEGNECGDKYDDIIAEHVYDCECFIAFMSSNYMNSDYCIKELNYAVHKRKSRFFVFLEDVELTKGIEMHNHDLHHIFKYEYANDDYFYKKLFRSHTIEYCKGNYDTDIPHTQNYQTIRYDNGWYIGELKDGVPHGRGRFIWANGNVYEGDFVNGERTGNGKYKSADGDIYEGEFREGILEGKGKYIWENGDVYEGDFASGKPHGYGKKTYHNGEIEIGKWDKNLFVGRLSRRSNVMY